MHHTTMTSVLRPREEITCECGGLFRHDRSTVDYMTITSGKYTSVAEYPVRCDSCGMRTEMALYEQVPTKLQVIPCQRCGQPFTTTTLYQEGKCAACTIGIPEPAPSLPLMGLTPHIPKFRGDKFGSTYRFGVKDVQVGDTMWRAEVDTQGSVHYYELEVVKLTPQGFKTQQRGCKVKQHGSVNRRACRTKSQALAALVKRKRAYVGHCDYRHAHATAQLVAAELGKERADMTNEELVQMARSLNRFYD